MIASSWALKPMSRRRSASSRMRTCTGGGALSRCGTHQPRATRSAGESPPPSTLTAAPHLTHLKAFRVHVGRALEHVVQPPRRAHQDLAAGLPEQRHVGGGVPAGVGGVCVCEEGRGRFPSRVAAFNRSRASASSSARQARAACVRVEGGSVCARASASSSRSRARGAAAHVPPTSRRQPVSGSAAAKGAMTEWIWRASSRVGDTITAPT